MTVELSGVVVHWHREDDLAALVAAWPADPRFELLVVDNGSTEPLPKGPEILRPDRNLGFGGGANYGIERARGSIVLVLNPDAIPGPGALERLLDGFDRFPGATGLAPRLLGPDGSPQWSWQLKPVPSPGRLVLQLLLPLPTTRLAREPAAGAPVGQPAAAALALRREALLALGGFDPGFYPAWFEDVDLARRMAARGLTIRYWPDARFVHHLGSTVPRLGYGRFLAIYSRNLLRYLEKHHGHGWTRLGRLLLPLGAALRIAALPIRRPRRAASRREALDALRSLPASVARLATEPPR